MTTSIELEDLAQKREQRRAEAEQHFDSDDQQTEHDEVQNATIAAWAWATAVILTLMSFVLLLFPRFLLFLSTSADYSETSLSPLERFLSLHFSLFLFAISATLILYIPSEDPLESHSPKRRRDSLGHPLLGPLTGASVLCSFISYNTKSVSSLAFLVFLLSGVIGAWGLWVMLFEGTSRISKKTGADKHTSAFLFGNKQAASLKKKEWKKTQREKAS